MGQSWSRVVEQARTALAAALVSALLVVLPLTGSSVLTASELVAVSLAVLALAAALARAPRFATPLLTHVAGFPVAGTTGPPVLRTRKTDPTHHPLAPRAPGLA